MKRVAMVFSLLVVLVLAFFISERTVTMADEQIDLPLSERTVTMADEQIEIPIKETSGMKAFGILHDEFLADDLTREGWVKDFYECYGGAYLDDEGNLTVYYQKDSAEAAARTKEYVDGLVQDEIAFVPVDYSYKGLLDLQKRVFSTKESVLKSGVSSPLEKIQSVGICQKDNCLRLMTDALSKQEVSEITELLEDIPFQIEAMDGAVYRPE